MVFYSKNQLEMIFYNKNGLEMTFFYYKNTFENF